MSTLMARALEAARLDLLVLGGLADRLRRAERGDVVRVHVDPVKEDGVRTYGKRELDQAGDANAFLRAIAIDRLTGESGPLRVDAEGIGLPLAQVALAFGADEIVAPIRRIALEVYGDESAFVLRERELAALVRAASRTPRIVEHRDGEAIEREPDTTTKAARKFRAPGRDVRPVEES